VQRRFALLRMRARGIDQAPAFLWMGVIFPNTPSEGSIDPIGIAHEKDNHLTRLTPRVMLALY
jgi:hypothetical protein